MSAYQCRFKAFLAEPLERVFALLETSLGSDIALLDATNRSLLAQGGKRIRPGLTLLAAGACGGVNGDTVRFAAAAEMIHNATLLHDDVVDGSEMRRGRPTLQALMGGTASVLTGDYWLVKALECILDAKGEERDEVLRMFSWTLSSLASGEILQLQMALSGETKEEEYLRIIRCKTACLFETAAVSGALAEEAAPEVVEGVRAFALNLGLAFQIRDDILDYTGGTELGKPVGQDLIEQKITLPLLEALTDATPEEEATIRRKVREIGDHPEYREEIVAFVAAHDGIARATGRLDGFIATAKDALHALGMTDPFLLQLADFTALRKV